MGERTALMDGWVTRVLGVRLAAPALSPAAASRLDAARPAEPPGVAMTAGLLAAMARTAPDADQALPAALTGMIPRFLLAIGNEPHLDAQPMAPGTPVPAPDQVLTVANALNAALRSARRWETLLGEAETANGSLDDMEAAERDEAAQDTYERLVTSYNTTRVAALKEETTCMGLVATLAAEFRAAQGAAAG